MSITRVPSSPVRPKTDEACTRAIAHRSHIDRPSIAHRSTSRAHPTWPGLKSSLITIGGVIPPVPEPATCWSVDQRVTTKTRRPTTTTTTTTTTRSVPHPLVHGGDDDDGGRPTTLCDDDDRGRHDAYISVYDDHTYTYTDRYGHATHAKGQRPFHSFVEDLISNHAHDAGWGGLIAPRVGVFYT